MTEPEPLDLDALQQEWEATTDVEHYSAQAEFLADAGWAVHAHEVFPRLIQRIKELEWELLQVST